MPRALKPYLLPLLLLGCDADPRALESGETLQVIAGRPGVVAVDGVRAGVGSVTPAVLRGLPLRPTYDVEVSSSGGRLFALGVLGPVVDLRAIEPGLSFLYGQRRTLVVRAEADGHTLSGIAMRANQVVRGQPVVGGLAFTVVGEGPIEVVVAWQVGRRVASLVRRRLTVWSEGTELQVSPRTVLDQPLVIDVAGGLAGWVEAELTLEGVRTGLVLGAGLAGGRVGLDGPARGALQIERPASFGPDVGIWLQATARQVGVARAVAEIGQHVGLQTDGVTLRFPDAPQLAPAPSTPEGAPVFSRAAPVARWGSDSGAAWVSLGLDAVGCGSARWTVAGDPALGELQVPEASGDVLDAPLLAVWAERVEIGDLGYEAVTGPDTPRAELVPKVAARWGRRAVRGYWRGGASTCAPDARAGLYTVQSIDADCALGGSGQTVLVDRCGALVPLASGPLACGALVGARLNSPGRAALEVVDAAGGLALVGAGAALLLTPQAGPMAPPLPALGGDWFRYQLTERSHDRAEDGSLGIARTAPVRVAEGDASGGPWVVFEAGGRVRSAVPRQPWSGRLLDFDGADGRLEIDDAGCAGEVRSVVLGADEGGLTLTETVVVDEATAQVRVLTLWRR